MGDCYLKSYVVEDEENIVNFMRKYIAIICSFDNNIDECFQIYKEDGNWVLEYLDGEEKKTRVYTNLYDACLSLLRAMTNFDLFEIYNPNVRIPAGTRVIIDEDSFIDDVIDNKNTILKMGTIHDSFFDCLRGKKVYAVYLDTGELITGTNEMSSDSEFTIKTIEQYIIKLHRELVLWEAAEMDGETVHNDKANVLRGLLNYLELYKADYLQSRSGNTK